ncbi:type II toxin-antitoxin system HicB family antitoxin [Leptolyngbyaceae cyanobacterium UHCC 1019]
MKFQVLFIFDPEYQGYVAEVPALPGCLSQGKTLDEAIANIRDAIKGYLIMSKRNTVNRFSLLIWIFSSVRLPFDGSLI